MKRKVSFGGYIFLVVFLAQVSHPIHLIADSTEAVPRISVTDAEKLMDNPDVVIIDVRKKKAWWRSTIKIHGAVREDPSTVSQWVEKYPKTKILIFYCD
jgi:hypothetical protein